MTLSHVFGTFISCVLFALKFPIAYPVVTTRIFEFVKCPPTGISTCVFLLFRYVFIVLEKADKYKENSDYFYELFLSFVLICSQISVH